MAVNVYDGTRWLNLGTGHIYTDSGWQILHPQDKLYCPTKGGVALGNGAYRVYVGATHFYGVSSDIEDPFENSVAYHLQFIRDDPSNLRFFSLYGLSETELAEETEWHSMTIFSPSFSPSLKLLRFEGDFDLFDVVHFIVCVFGPPAELESLELEHDATLVYP